MNRAIRAVVALVVTVGTWVGIASPASAATQSIGGTVLTTGWGFVGDDFYRDGLVVLGDPLLATVRVLEHSAPWLPCGVSDSTEAFQVSITATDGSQLVANVDSTTCADIVAPLPGGISLGTERASVTITGGTGRFAGATGSGTLDTTMVSVAARYWISSFDLQVTTP